MDKEKARIKIMEGTIEEFNEKGLKFTMDGVAKRIGMSKKTLYNIFDDKEQLFRQTVDYTFDEIKKSEKIILEDEEMDIVEKLKRVIIVLPDRYNNIDFSKVFLFRGKYPEICAHIENRIETGWEPTLQLVTEAIAQGRVKEISLPVFRAMVEGTIEKFLNSDVLADNDIPYDFALKQMINILIDGIRKV